MADALSRISTEVAAIVPTKIALALNDVLYQELPWNDLITIEPYDGPGIDIKKGQNPTLTANNLSEAAAYGMTDDGSTINRQAFTITSRTITAGMVGLDVGFTWPALDGAQGNLEAEFIKSARAAVADKFDTDIMAKYTDASAAAPDHEIGTVGIDPDYALVLAGHQLLWSRSAVPNFLMWGSGQLTAVLNIPEFKEFRILGRAQIENKIMPKTGFLGLTPFGTPMYWSNKASTAGGAAGHAILGTKEALAVEMKAEPVIFIDTTQLKTKSRTVTMSITLWYGVGGAVDTALGNTRMVELVS